MLNDIIVSLIPPALSGMMVLIVGYFVLRNEQKNRNKIIDDRFDSTIDSLNNKFNIVSKDVVQNDKRLRKDILDQNMRNDKMFNRLENEVVAIHNKQVEDGEKILASSLTMRSVKDSVDSLSERMDLIIKILMEKSREKS